MTGTVVREYSSLKIAAKEVGVTSGSIINAIKRKGSSAGFRWAYSATDDRHAEALWFSPHCIASDALVQGGLFPE
jgi:hypothetical protein